MGCGLVQTIHKCSVAVKNHESVPRRNLRMSLTLIRAARGVCDS
jgi:hypothetical protein